MTILLTGAAGFIGANTTKALLDRGERVIGVDNLNEYYTPQLKRYRLASITSNKNFTFHELDICDRDALKNIARAHNVKQIVHLAAQAGVRYSIEDPYAYEHSNLNGHLCVLEVARALNVEHLVYASSSSVYGANTKTPFAEADVTDAPVSLYGASKKANELMSSSYSRLYQLPQTGLRFFTVYGPAGRPDMAYWIFTEKMLAGKPIDVFNHGKMGRDFTYIDDIVAGILAALDHPPSNEHSHHRVFNLGNDQPEELMTLIELLEQSFGITVEKNYCDMQNGDVVRTWADISLARQILGYAPKTSLADGVSMYAKWRKSLDKPFI